MSAQQGRVKVAHKTGRDLVVGDVLRVNASDEGFLILGFAETSWRRVRSRSGHAARLALNMWAEGVTVGDDFDYTVIVPVRAPA